MEASVQTAPSDFEVNDQVTGEQFVGESMAPSPSDLQPDVRRPVPREFIDYPGRRLTLMALTPAGLFGIAVGATAVVLNLASQSAHVWGMAIVWGATTVISILAIIAGIRENSGYLRSWAGNGNLGEAKIAAAAPDGTKPDEWPGASGRYQSLKSLNPET